MIDLIHLSRSRIGRKPVFFLNIVIFLVGGTVNIFAPTFIIFVTSRAIAQSTFPSLYNTFFTLGKLLIIFMHARNNFVFPAPVVTLHLALDPGPFYSIK